MKASDIYSNAFLRAADLEGKTLTFTIKNVDTGELPDGKQQLIVEFRETESKLGLNKTNKNVLVDLYGDETDEWIGKKVSLYPTRVDFQGKRVDAIRIEDRKPEQKSGPGAAADDNDPIPF